jgi:hypothetical protein
MKHLKSFNEDITSFSFEEDLQEFCEMNLAYLLDDAELQVIESPGGWSELHLIRIKLDETKTWDEIKDHMIPFLTRLNNKYEISSKVYSVLNSSPLDVRSDHKCGNIRFYSGANTDEIYPNESYVEVSVEDLINDIAITAIKLYRYRLDDIRIYIKIDEKPKKSILTKIKSFFK